MKYSVSIDVPSLAEGIKFYSAAFRFDELARPVDGYAILARGAMRIGLLEKAAGTLPADGSSDVRHYDRHWTPVHVDFYVEDFEAVLADAIDAGARCEQRHVGKDHPAVAFCSDPFGNGFCIIEAKEER